MCPNALRKKGRKQALKKKNCHLQLFFFLQNSLCFCFFYPSQNLTFLQICFSLFKTSIFFSIRTGSFKIPFPSFSRSLFFLFSSYFATKNIVLFGMENSFPLVHFTSFFYCTHFFKLQHGNNKFWLKSLRTSLELMLCKIS